MDNSIQIVNEYFGMLRLFDKRVKSNFIGNQNDGHGDRMMEA